MSYFVKLTPSQIAEDRAMGFLDEEWETEEWQKEMSRLEDVAMDERMEDDNERPHS